MELEVDYIRTSSGYAWKGTNVTCCIMAVKYGRDMFGGDLDELVTKKILTVEERHSISRFDANMGNNDDLTILRKLAHRLGLDMIEVEY